MFWEGKRKIPNQASKVSAKIIDAQNYFFKFGSFDAGVFENTPIDFVADRGRAAVDKIELAYSFNSIPAILTARALS